MPNLTPTISNSGEFEQLVRKIAQAISFGLEPNEIMQKYVLEGYASIDVKLAYAGAQILINDQKQGYGRFKSVD